MNIHEFTSQFRHGGARSTLFRVDITNPVAGEADGLVPFMVKSASHPTWTTTELQVPYMGRQLYYSGHRTVEPWTTTVINDEDFKVRNAIEAWQNAINRQQENVRDFASPSDAEYKTVGKIFQYSKIGQITREYSLIGLWPQNVSAIDLAWDNDSIQEYSVTWRFDYFEVTGGTTGAAGGTSAGAVGG